MASSILQNKKGSVVLHATSNTTWIIAGNNSVSNVALTDEVITGASIRQVWFGSPASNSAYWTIKRGANTVAVLDSTDHIPFAAAGSSLGSYPAANVTVELTGAGDNAGYIMIELSKAE